MIRHEPGQRCHNPDRLALQERLLAQLRQVAASQFVDRLDPGRPNLDFRCFLQKMRERQLYLERN